MNVLHSQKEPLQPSDLNIDPKVVANLSQSSDAKMLVNLLNQSAGDGLKGAAMNAMKGDTTQLMGIVNQLLKNPEAAKAIENLSQTMPKK